MGTVVEVGAPEVHHEVTRTKEQTVYIMDRTAIIDPLRKCQKSGTTFFVMRFYLLLLWHST